jgi:small GTP-binding protein
MPEKPITIALAGNPNSGKTTVFNAITGSRQHVGNWPGVTVEKKEGFCLFDGQRINVVDLPGTYSLTAYSLDEVVARDYVINGHPDVVVDVVDASNLERNLYLTVQMMEMRTKLVVALNMMDVARTRGYEINVPKLAELTGAPVIPLVASRGEGVRDLLATVVKVADGKLAAAPQAVHYGQDIESEVEKLSGIIAGDKRYEAWSPRWLAVKLLEEDREVVRRVREVEGA